MTGSAIRLLVSDIDGTLIGTDKLLAPSTVDAVRALADAGILLCLASSRSVRGMRMYLDQLELTTPSAGLNGAEIIAAGGAVLERRPLDPDAARRTIETLTEHGVESWIFTDAEWLISNPAGAFVPRERSAVRVEPTLVETFDDHYGAVGKIMGATADYPLLERVEALLQTMLGDRVNAHRSSPWYLDVTHPDANKGNAALRLAALLGVAADEMACIGDMDNDIAMLNVAGLSIAMGNAPDHVRQVAQHVTDGNNEDGWANAVRRLILPRGPRAGGE